MAKNLTIALLAVALLALLARHAGEPGTPWKPVLEATGFEYLDDHAARLGAELDALARLLGPDPQPPVRAALGRLDHLVAHLRDYYLPLTRVRQLVYDADRLLFLGDETGARRNLATSVELLRGVGGSGGRRLETLSEELILIADRALLHLEGTPDAAEEPLRTLGHRVNLLLLKGELELDD